MCEGFDIELMTTGQVVHIPPISEEDSQLIEQYGCLDELEEHRAELGEGGTYLLDVIKGAVQGDTDCAEIIFTLLRDTE